MSEGFQGTTDLYRAVFAAAPDAIVVVGRDGRILLVNPKVHDLFGYEAGELEGQLVEVLVPDAYRSGHSTRRESYRKAPRSRAMGLGMELRGRRKDGTEFPIEVALSPVDSAGSEALADWVIAIVRDVTERARSRALGAARIQATEAERRRIAQDLHDDTAQRLAALLIQIKLEGRAPGGLDAAALQYLRDQIEDISDGVRSVARGLRPPELDDVGLAAALRTWARTVSEDRELRVVVEADEVRHLIDAEQQLMLYRIVQESITNVVRHAGATEARVSLQVTDAFVEATVADDGCGFDSVRVFQEGTRLGIPGMLERATMIGATLRIESAHQAGTTVTVTLPFGEKESSTQPTRDPAMLDGGG